MRNGAVMSDFIETVIFPIVGFAVLIFVVVGGFVLIAGPSKEQEMYKHCIEDGNKDYVCYKMTHTETDYVPMPMPIPMRTK